MFYGNQKKVDNFYFRLLLVIQEEPVVTVAFLSIYLAKRNRPYNEADCFLFKDERSKLPAVTFHM